MKYAVLLLMLFPVSHFAQMQTDRPGEGTASTIISPKTIQLESGLVYDRSEKGFTSDHLVRFGLTESWEVRFQTTQNFNDSAESTYGFSSKYQFIQGEDFSPSLTLIADSDFEFKEYSFILASDKALTENWNAAAGFGYVKNEDLDYLFTSLGVDYSIGERWAIFGEYYGYFNSTLSPEHGADLGITYLASPRLQLDLSFGSNIEYIPSQYFLSMGISYQFR